MCTDLGHNTILHVCYHSMPCTCISEVSGGISVYVKPPVGGCNDVCNRNLIISSNDIHNYAIAQMCYTKLTPIREACMCTTVQTLVATICMMQGP